MSFIEGRTFRPSNNVSSLHTRTAYQAVDNGEHCEKITIVNGNITYVCRSNKLGALVSEAVWQIHRISIIGGTTYVHWAENSDDYTFVQSSYLTYFDSVANPNYASIFFDGVSDYLTAGAVAALNVERTDSRTWSMFVRFGTSATGQIFTKRIANAKGWAITKLVTSNAIEFFLTNTAATNLVRVSMTNSLSTGVWYHIAVTYSGNSLASGVTIWTRAYGASSATPWTVANGGLSITSNNLSATTIDAASLANIGSQANGSNLISGNIDEVSMFNVEFTQSEIDDLSDPLGVPNDITTHSRYANCIGWWKMGEGSSFPTINDEISTNDFTMTSMVAGNIVNSYPGSVL